MTKFEQIGVNRQYNSDSIDEANSTFNNSCTLCCMKGLHIDCRHCAIEAAHALVVATFADKENNK